MIILLFGLHSTEIWETFLVLIRHVQMEHINTAKVSPWGLESYISSAVCNGSIAMLHLVYLLLNNLMDTFVRPLSPLTSGQISKPSFAPPCWLIICPGTKVTLSQSSTTVDDLQNFATTQILLVLWLSYEVICLKCCHCQRVLGGGLGSIPRCGDLFKLESVAVLH